MFSVIVIVYCLMLGYACDVIVQSSEELDTDTEFEPVEDMTIETRSRCKIFFLNNNFIFGYCDLFVMIALYIRNQDYWNVFNEDFIDLGFKKLF